MDSDDKGAMIPDRKVITPSRSVFIMRVRVIGRQEGQGYREARGAGSMS